MKILDALAVEDQRARKRERLERIHKEHMDAFVRSQGRSILQKKKKELERQLELATTTTTTAAGAASATDSTTTVQRVAREGEGERARYGDGR